MVKEVRESHIPELELLPPFNLEIGLLSHFHFL
jgi:hypothetical protein